MDAFTTDHLRQLLVPRTGPCASLYVPAHRAGSSQDPIRWRNAVAEARRQLAQLGLAPPELDEFLAPADRLLEDPPFWRDPGDGVACFLAPDFHATFRLGVPWREQVVVGDHFLVKPLLPWLDGHAFYVLALSHHKARLVRGMPHGAREVPFPEGAFDPEIILPPETDGDTLGIHTAGRGPGRWAAVFHGHGLGTDDAKDHLLRYFRAVARAIQPVLVGRRTPLVLAGVEYLWPIFRDVCDYPHVVAEGVSGNPDRQSAAVLADLARPLVEPLLRQKDKAALATLRQLAGTGRTTTDPAEVVAAALGGRIETLFVQPDRDLWGRVEEAGRVVVHDAPQPGDVELTNLAVVGTLRRGRAVQTVGPGDLPGGAALAAVSPLPMAKHHKHRP